MAPSTSNVFISYNHRDKDFVRRLVGDLRSRGVQIWLDEWEIGVGESIVQRVSEGIDTSAYLAAVLSPNSVDAPWARYELDSAMMKHLSAERGITVLPLVIADCEIPLSLRHIKYADFRRSYEYGLQQLLRAIGAMGFSWINQAAEKIVQAGRDAARAGQYDEAEERFWQVLEQFPDYPPALSGLANVRYYQGRYQEGINCASKAINVAPDFPYAYYQRALCRWAEGNPAEAGKDLQHALDLKPDFEYARNKLRELRRQGY
jgi:tetratricopeptide (TPR) repeat protein